MDPLRLSLRLRLRLISNTWLVNPNYIKTITRSYWKQMIYLSAVSKYFWRKTLKQLINKWAVSTNRKQLICLLAVSSSISNASWGLKGSHCNPFWFPSLCNTNTFTQSYTSHFFGPKVSGQYNHTTKMVADKKAMYLRILLLKIRSQTRLKPLHEPCPHNFHFHSR